MAGTVKDVSGDDSNRKLTPAETPPARPSIQRVGNYRIIEEIGSGGMAVVYRGLQESLGRVVAIKALKTSLSSDASILARFEREALSVASFQHENIITLYDFFKERGALFMVMEFVEGIDLYDLLERCQQIPHEIAAIMALQVARALDYAHFRGVIHRDVKPANVIISRLGEVKLTDFGIARTEHSDLTEAGIGLGTPAYMSPEQILGDHLDHRSDIWSLGVVLYQMITGRKPFVDDEQRSAMQRIRLEEAVLPRDISPDCPKELQRIILQCMGKLPEDRYLSTQELVVELEQYLAAHVTSNYRLRVVFYLKDQGVITDDETTAMLHPALIGGERSLRGGIRVRRRARKGRILAMMFLLSAVLVAGAALGWFGFERYRAHPASSDPDLGKYNGRLTVCRHPGAPRTGRLIVRVHPWAHVKVDGTRLATTPIARPIVLPIGKHRVVLENPYYKALSLEIEIRANKDTLVANRLEPSDTDRPSK